MKRKCRHVECVHFIARDDFRLIDCEIEKVKYCQKCTSQNKIDNISTADYFYVINKYSGSNSLVSFYIYP